MLTRPLLLVLLSLMLYSCEKKQEVLPELTVPGTYDGSTFSRAAQETALVNNLEALARVMRSAPPGENVNVRDLGLAFSTNSPSVKSATTPYYISQLEGSTGYFTRLSEILWNPYAPADPPSGKGGIYGGYLFDSQGVEWAEVIEKGLYGAALYNQALALYLQNPNINNPATADQLLALYGATPDFVNKPNSAQSPRSDRAVAALAARYDKNDGSGLYSQIKQNFLTLQAAYTAGEKYTKQRDQAFSAILTLWEKVEAAAAIHACQQIVALLSTPAPDINARAKALHACSTVLGILSGFKTVPNKVLTDAQIDELLTALNFPPQGTPEVYKVATSPASELPKIRGVIGRLKTIYGFSDQEIEDLKKDWAQEQGR